jgi:hypothetical protein
MGAAQYHAAPVLRRQALGGAAQLATLGTLETERAALWRTLSTEEKSRLKAASEAAAIPSRGDDDGSVWEGSMTKQEMFDKVVAGLASQGFARSLAMDGTCAYRGEGGLRCAAGWLLSDEDYTPDMEGSLVGDGVRFALFLGSGHGRPERNLLRALQAAHDQEAGSADELKAVLRDVGKRYRLALPECLR